MLQVNIVKDMEALLQKLIFNENIPQINSGREICISNALYLYFIILNKYHTSNNISDVICTSLTHKSYEVILAALNYLLILYDSLEIENRFHEHLSKIKNDSALRSLRNNSEYLPSLCKILKHNKYQECVQKTLKVLTLEQNTEKYIVLNKIQEENLTDDVMINTLFDCIVNEHENLTHIYLQGLSNFVTKKIQDSSVNRRLILEVIRMIFACSSSDNSDSTRSVVVNFLERNFESLLKLDLDELLEEEKCEFYLYIFNP